MFVCQRVVRRGWRINQSIAINQSINQHQAAWTHVRTRTHTHAQRPAAFDFWDALPCHHVTYRPLPGSDTTRMRFGRYIHASYSIYQDSYGTYFQARRGHRIRALQAERRLRHRNRAETRATAHTHTPSTRWDGTRRIPTLLLYEPCISGRAKATDYM
ncbi:hypothetical protein M431DRAFT_466829 [Trichoderma harzianum CBS 226.95]|uniref:Uncharacterized protein n=1 Tax=Trichoderma harzianum CBS 226.95 TaxID=983964 RepID=A0A2T4A6G6_TRIHA|nr:hypothetical protein M431DRAFT_466829 [Trichoderma harzianum CBS 226.95]PTB52608.1 hypothetical protein M431DRAFT_466829 [Trichoderma harzianum CBS 226.95]